MNEVDKLFKAFDKLADRIQLEGGPRSQGLTELVLELFEKEGLRDWAQFKKYLHDRFDTVSTLTHKLDRITDSLEDDFYQKYPNRKMLELYYEKRHEGFFLDMNEIEVYYKKVANIDVDTKKLRRWINDNSSIVRELPIKTGATKYFLGDIEILLQNGKEIQGDYFLKDNAKYMIQLSGSK